MCYGCWESYGKPKIDNADVREAVLLIDRVYSYSVVGGNLHCELDDWNIEDRFWEKFVIYPFAADTPVEQLEAELKCWFAMRNLSLEERASALAMYDGFFDTD